MTRCAFCAWIPLWPWPVGPLAGQCLWGQPVVVGAMRVLLALCGSMPRGVYLGPHLRDKGAAPRLSAELPVVLCWKKKSTIAPKVGRRPWTRQEGTSIPHVGFCRTRSCFHCAASCFFPSIVKLYFPLNFRTQTASEFGFKPPTKRFVKLARLSQVPSKFEKWRANPRFYVLRADIHCR